MKFASCGDNFNLLIYDYKDINIEEIKKYIKDLVCKLKKVYKKKISGFYNVNVFMNDKIGMILDFSREDDFDFFRDVVDLNVIVNKDSEIYLKFSDIFLLDNFDNIYFWDNYFYVDVNSISFKEFYYLLEDSSFIYGRELDSLKNKFSLVCKQ